MTIQVEGVSPDIIQKAWTTLTTLMDRMETMVAPDMVQVRHADNKSFENVHSFLMDMLRLEREGGGEESPFVE